MQVVYEVVAAHEAAQRDMRNAVAHAIRCGNHLIEVKAQLGHGKFGPWCASLPFSYRTAAAYMQVARHTNVQRAAHLEEPSIREALKLATKPPKPKDEQKKKRAKPRGKAQPQGTGSNAQSSADSAEPEETPSTAANTTKPQDMVMARILRDLAEIERADLTNPNEAAQMLFRHAHRLSAAAIFLNSRRSR